MQPRRRRPPPPWERGRQEPRHPLGHARRRWPREYDGGVPGAAPRLNPRYRRAFDGGDPTGERRTEGGVRRRRSTLDRIRRNPVRHGLVGLAVAGAAAPITMARYQQVVRNDPSHEQILTHTPVAGINEMAVANAWRAAAEEAEARAMDPREVTIAEKLERYRDLGLDRDLAEDIYDIALENDIDPEVAFGLVRTESEFKNHATSRVGAMGLTQLMPKTAEWLEPGTRTSDLRNPETNLKIGFRYLRDLINKYEGDERLALLAYNRGPGTVDRVLKRGGDPDNGYAEAVITGKGVH
ncbi:MAG TPA: lytic transglycosylase domain-containing protein [Longimicrobiaceae bacterium]|nr:lytic transglycosylase domain-containing protein [Longimicrobiaceae bacterium]